MSQVVRDVARMFAEPSVLIEKRTDGSRILRSGVALPETYSRCMGEWLVQWASQKPDQVFLAERGLDGAWEKLTYAEAHRQVRRISSWLLGQNLSAQRPVVVLSENGIEHALLSLAAMYVGVPVCSISTGYSLASKDHLKLKANIELMRPGVIYADNISRFDAALKSIASLHDGVIVAGSRGAALPGTTTFTTLLAKEDSAAVDRAFNAIDHDTIAKFIFTSGSVGAPKAVTITQRMLCSNMAMKDKIWPFLLETPPVILDWLPWSHVFGGNHNFNLVLHFGGTLYIDEGKPTPAGLDKTLRNLKEVSPSIYFSVPLGYDMLVPALRSDAALRKSFFSRLQLIFYAGAALPQHLWDELERLAEAEVGTKVLMVSSWGSTETAPACTDCHFEVAKSGTIGVPVPGTELKLVPSADKLEVRVRGPNVTPGYWKQPDITAKSFDDEGFYMIGDAVEFVDEARPELGLLFDGRVGEDFKLLSGTWIHVGTVRVAGIDAMSPVAQDIVVTGHDRDEICFLIFPNVPECRTLCPDLAADAPVSQVLAHPAVVDRVKQGFAALAKGASSTKVRRAILLAEPPSAEYGEITEKGYLNQRMVLNRRADLVAKLYTAGAQPGVICLE
ncbi:MAG: feruloyl-CoA synthase [Rhodocyclaceae bacterium]|nr:MAG: feruloyl-CoA synthase [Rhodocyclaceae bacterium]